MRRLGSNTQWNSAGWNGGPDGGSTWAPATDYSALSGVLLIDPDPSAGVAVGPRAIGGLRFVVEALNPTESYAGTGAQWDSAQWDSAIWLTPAGKWNDITARVRGIAWGHGQTDPLNRAEVGTGSLTLDNRDGLACSWATSGPFTAAGSSWLKAGVLIRWGVICTNPAALVAAGLPALDPYTPLYTGTIENAEEGGQDNVDAWLTVTLVETLAELATAPGTTTLTPQKATSALYMLLMEAGWKYQRALMEVPNDDADITPITFTTESSIERLQRIADCVHWDVITDGRGRAKIIPRKQAEGSSGFVFSNAPSGTELPVERDGIQPYSSTDRVLNVATASSPTGEVQVASASASVSEFGQQSNKFGFPRSDLPLADADVLALVRKVVRLRARDDRGIAGLKVNGDLDPARYPAVFTYLATAGRGGTSFGTRWVHASGAEMSMELLAEGQSHTVTMEGAQLLWNVTYETGSAS